MLAECWQISYMQELVKLDVSIVVRVDEVENFENFSVVRNKAQAPDGEGFRRRRYEGAGAMRGQEHWRYQGTGDRKEKISGGRRHPEILLKPLVKVFRVPWRGPNSNLLYLRKRPNSLTSIWPSPFSSNLVNSRLRTSCSLFIQGLDMKKLP